ncbi:MAG: hypothetical protein Phyf2KO_04160 [Phycisphaerales bacterium]
MRYCVFFIVYLFVTCAVYAQHESVHDRFELELEALAPTNPYSYFLLAEEVAETARRNEEVALARRLYVLSVVLSQSNESTAIHSGFSVSASAAVGLAALETIESRKVWLRALAGRIDSRYAAKRWDVPTEAPSADEVSLLLSEAIGLALSGDGSLSRARFDDPRVQSLLENTRDGANGPNSKASASRILREAEVWPCPECGNARIVPDRSKGGNARRLCSTCRGNPGPVVDKQTLVDYLAYQSALLDGTQTSWSAELAVLGATPLRDPDVTEIAPTMNVDPELVYYRNRRWVSRDDVLENDRGE